MDLGVSSTGWGEKVERGGETALLCLGRVLDA